MKDKRAFFRILQMSDGTFPTGGFSQSWGLETYVFEGDIKDGEGFADFLRNYLRSTIGKCEGPIAREAMDLATGYLHAKDDERDAILEDLVRLEETACASRVTKESREGALRMGKAFLRVMEPLMGTEDTELIERFRSTRGTYPGYPVAYGLVCGLSGVDKEDAMTAYIFTTANTLCQSALKLIPLGNVEAQDLLNDAGEYLEEIHCLCMNTNTEEITNFCPGIDIAGTRHEELDVRLYMS